MTAENNPRGVTAGVDFSKLFLVSERLRDGPSAPRDPIIGHAPPRNPQPGCRQVNRIREELSPNAAVCRNFTGAIDATV